MPAFGSQDNAALAVLSSVLTGGEYTRLPALLYAHQLAEDVSIEYSPLNRDPSLFYIKAALGSRVDFRLAGEAIDDVLWHLREDVSRFHRQAYRPEETVLAAAGNLTLEEIAALVKKDFGNWPAAEKTEEASASLSIRKKPVVLVIDRPLVQASVYLTFVGTPAASPDTPALSLLSHLLADSAESRLGQKLREQKGWTYGVRSGVKAWRQTGLFSLAMSVPYEEVQKVARRYLDPQKAEVTVMGDTRAIGQYAPALVQGKLPQWRSTDSGKEEER